jgi:hypothetical protein
MKKKDRSERRVTTSIRIDPDLWFKAKLSALQRRMKISEYIEYLIKREINTTNGKKD